MKLAIGSLALLAATPGAAQASTPISGKEAFEARCSGCHSESGWATRVLKRRLPGDQAVLARRTGLTAAFVALFFLLALFFAPLAGMVPAYATAAALLYVACVMTQGLAEIEWSDLTEFAPAVVTAVTMPLTYSIATGIGLGFITYVLCKLIAGKFTEARPAVVALAILFGIKFAIAG